MTLKKKLMMSAGLLALSTGLAAAVPAVVQTDVNLRTGPGTNYDVLTALPAGATVDVIGCQQSWCRVSYAGTSGFASRGYLGLGGGVAAGPAYRTFGQGYVSGGYEPGYGFDQGDYSNGYTPGYTYGYYGTPDYYGRRYSGGYYGDERGFRGEREGGFRGERERTFRGESTERVGAVRATRGESARATRGESESVSQIQGNNPMINAGGAAATNAPGERTQRVGARNAAQIQGNNPRINARGAAAANPRRGGATTGAAER
jgi:uncharacterized protein YraI